MAVRKSTVYIVVLLVLTVWFGLIIYLSYDNKSTFNPLTSASLHRGTGAEFALSGALNIRPDAAPPQAGAVNSLLVMLKNRNGSDPQPLLLPQDEFSCARVQIRPVGGKNFTYNALVGDPHRGVITDGGGKPVQPLWHTLMLGPGQGMAKEVVLPKSAFPTPGDYEIILLWKTDDFERLNGHVAPPDRQSLVLDLTATQKVSIPGPDGAKPAAAPTAAPAPASPPGDATPPAVGGGTSGTGRRPAP